MSPEQNISATRAIWRYAGRRQNISSPHSIWQDIDLPASSIVPNTIGLQFTRTLVSPSAFEPWAIARNCSGPSIAHRLGTQPVFGSHLMIHMPNWIGSMRTSSLNSLGLADGRSRPSRLPYPKIRGDCESPPLVSLRNLSCRTLPKENATWAQFSTTGLYGRSTSFSYRNSWFARFANQKWLCSAADAARFRPRIQLP